MWMCMLGVLVGTTQRKTPVQEKKRSLLLAIYQLGFLIISYNFSSSVALFSALFSSGSWDRWRLDTEILFRNDGKDSTQYGGFFLV
jgi:hypothetical protein